jgi:hypothetical protein
VYLVELHIHHSLLFTLSIVATVVKEICQHGEGTLDGIRIANSIRFY